MNYVAEAPGDRSELHSEQELRRSSRIRKQVTDAPTPIKKPAKDSDINEPTTQKRIHRQQSVKTEKKLIKNVTVTMEKGKPPVSHFSIHDLTRSASIILFFFVILLFPEPFPFTCTSDGPSPRPVGSRPCTL